MRLTAALPSVAALLGLALLGPSPGAAQAAPAGQPDTAEAVLVELELGRITSRTVDAFRLHDDVLVPLAEVLELAEVRHSVSDSGVIEADLQPQNLLLRLDPAAGTLYLGKKRVPLSPALLRMQGIRAYVSLELLSHLLGLDLATSWGDLRVTILNPEALPIGARVAREEARQRLAASRPPQPDLDLRLDRRRWNGLTVEYSIMSPSSDPVGSGAYTTRVGSNALGGALELGLASQAGAGPRAEASWTGVWREQRYLRQVRLGDGLATGPRPRSMEGVSLTNAPYLRPTALGQITYAGDLGPGWQLEAYRGGRLIGFDSVNALGRFSMDVPVQYGDNPVDFVAYGPFGEVKRFDRSYRVLDDILPGNRFEYGLSAGACRTTRCQATANLDLRYGLNQRWTVQAGMDQFWRAALPSLFHPYLGITGSLGNAWGVQLEGVLHAVARAGLLYQPSASLQTTLEYNRFARNVEQPILTPDGRRSQWTATASYLPFSQSSSLTLDASLDRISALNGRSTSGRFGISFFTAGMRILPSLRLQRDALTNGVQIDHSYLGINTFILPHPALGSFLGRFSARTTLETEGMLRPVSASLYLARQVSRGVRVEGGMGWQRGVGPTLLLTVSTNLSAFRAYSTLTAPPSGPASATQYLQGSAVYDRAQGGVTFMPDPAIERAGLSGHVFLDANANGRFDAGEELLPGVRVRAGYSSAVADSSGEYRIWNLVPFEPVLLTVDTLSLPSPLWVPAFAAARVEPGPNQYRTLDIPVVPGGVVEGRLVRETPTGPQPMGGVEVVLRELSTGHRRTLVTFSDGEIYGIGIRPGRYEMTADPEQLRRSGLRSVPVQFTLPASIQGATVEGLELRLVSGNN